MWHEVHPGPHQAAARLFAIRGKEGTAALKGHSCVRGSFPNSSAACTTNRNFCPISSGHLLTLDLVAGGGERVEPARDVAHARVQPAAPRQQRQAVALPAVVLQASRLHHALGAATLVSRLSKTPATDPTPAAAMPGALRNHRQPYFKHANHPHGSRTHHALLNIRPVEGVPPCQWMQHACNGETCRLATLQALQRHWQQSTHAQ